jgi:hypothetical protein
MNDIDADELTALARLSLHIQVERAVRLNLILYRIDEHGGIVAVRAKDFFS